MTRVHAVLVAVVLAAGLLVVVSVVAQSKDSTDPARMEGPAHTRWPARPAGRLGQQQRDADDAPDAVEGQDRPDRRRGRGAEAARRALRRPGRRRDLRQLRPADARRERQGRVRAGLVRPDHRQLQPVLDGRSRLGQPHVAHHRSARRPVSAVDARRAETEARLSGRRARSARRGRRMARRSSAHRALHLVRRAADGRRTTTATCRSSSRPTRGAPAGDDSRRAHRADDDRPHLPASIRQLHGDPRGRWEGDTLVVETTNYLNGFQGSTNNVMLTERYTRVSPDFINWQITVDDPATWTKPYTFMIG